MTLIGLLLTLALFGFLLWLITTYIPMPAPIRQVIIVIAVIVLILWLLSIFGGVSWINRPIAR